MYAAKEGGRGHLLFEPQLDRYSPRRLSLAGALRSAIADGEIVLYFQPKAELTTGKIIGVEALARWQHPRLGLIGPSEFVPIAEQTGLIGPLTSHVLEEALRQVRQWSDDGEELSVAVNLSARSFLDSQLAVEIPKLLERTGVEARLLELEITESMLMLDPARAKATLDRLSSIGLSLSVDDFGTGYSSLANLKRLPVDGIKIDKSFVIDMPHDQSDAAIVRSTIDLAHNLGLKVVAEGVESHEAWRRLEELGCDLAQGFHVSRPLPADAMTRLLAERRQTRRDARDPRRAVPVPGRARLRLVDGAAQRGQPLHLLGDVDRRAEPLGFERQLLPLLAGAPQAGRAAVVQHHAGAADRAPDLLAQLLVRDQDLAVARVQQRVARAEQPRAAAVRRGLERFASSARRNALPTCTSSSSTLCSSALACDGAMPAQAARSVCVDGPRWCR